MNGATTQIIIAVLASSGVWAVINTITSFIIEKHRDKAKAGSITRAEFDAHGKALRGLLYGELERQCGEYLTRGYISAAELNDLQKYYYQPYHELGGDGTIDHLIERVGNLDIRGDEF